MSYVKCSHNECELAAQYAAEIFIPAIGYPTDLREWPSLICGLPLCLQHTKKFPASEFINNKDLHQGITLAFALNGSNMKPDFTKAFVKPVALDSQRYLNFMKASK